MSQPPYDSRVKVEASEGGDTVGEYWHRIKLMVDASADALIAVYGDNCWARHEYFIPSDDLAFLQGPVNQYVHTVPLP